MRNFILFVRRFFNLILFLALEIVCTILIARTNTLQGNDVLSSANTAAGLIYQKREDVVYYFGLRRMNDSLLNENARLRMQIGLANSFDTLADKSIHRSYVGSDSVHVVKYADYIYRQARVINNSVTAENNYITINRGSADGIHKNMAVITGSGVVGKVVNVSTHFSSVLSVLSVKQAVSSKLKDGTVGTVVWEGGRPDVLIMKDIPPQIKVRKGDSVFTTSYSFFPPDIMVGVVEKVQSIKKNNLHLLYLTSASNFRNLQYVYVVENKLGAERINLEDSTKSRQ